MKKFFRALLCATMAAVCVLPVAACGGTRGVIKDGKTVNIAIAKAGYGMNWLREIADKFETLYADEGYKINILEPRAGLVNATALSELRLGTSTGVDMYFTAGVYPSDVIDPNFGVCAETLDDVFSKGAINFDGSVDETPIENRMDPNFQKYLKANEHYYDFYYYVAPCGIVANKKVLAAYGITQLPRTTDELFECYDKIYYGANGKGGSLTTKVYPTTWGGANAYGYPLFSLYTYLSQIMGEEEYEKFFAMDDLLVGSNTIDAQGYQMYENSEIQEVLEAFIQQYDVMYSHPGSSSQRHDVAHSQIMRGLAAFMSNGEFFFNEVKMNFASALDDVTFMASPVISALGTKLKLDGTGNNPERCDEILRHMIKLIDEDRTLSETKTATESQFGISLTEEQVQNVFVARRTMFKQTQSDTYIVKDSPVKEVAKLFMRMLASSDAATVMSKYAMGSAYAPADILDDDYEFIKSAKKILNDNEHGVSLLMYIGSVRKKTNLYILPGYDATVAVKIASEIGVVQTPADRNYAELAEHYFETVKNDARTNWEKYMNRGGYTLA